MLVQRVMFETPYLKLWRMFYPNTKCTNGNSAAEMVRREFRWLQRQRDEERAKNSHYLSRHLETHGLLPPPIPQTSEDSEPEVPSEPAPEQKMKRCLGVPGRPCDQEIVVFRNRKRCASCAKEARRLQQRPHKRKYYRNHREQLRTKLRQRRSFDSIMEAIKKKRERVAALPEVVYEPDGKIFVVDPATGRRERLR